MMYYRFSNWGPFQHLQFGDQPKIARSFWAVSRQRVPSPYKKAARAQILCTFYVCSSRPYVWMSEAIFLMANSCSSMIKLCILLMTSWILACCQPSSVLVTINSRLVISAPDAPFLNLCIFPKYYYLKPVSILWILKACFNIGSTELKNCFSFRITKLLAKADAYHCLTCSVILHWMKMQQTCGTQLSLTRGYWDKCNMPR